MSRALLCLLAVAIVALVLVSQMGAGAPEARFAPDLQSPAATREVIVRLQPPLQALDKEDLSQRLDGRVTRRLPEIDSIGLRLTSDETVEAAIDRLTHIEGVVLAEPNHLVSETAAPVDPLSSLQSGYLDLIGAPAAWEKQVGDPAVKVAVLDSGIDLSHPDLQDAVWTNPLETPEDGLDNDNDGCIDDVHGCSFVSAGTVDPSCAAPGSPGEVDDDNGHGTFVSGIIAARASNGLGISGAAPAVTIVPVKILDCTGGGTVLDAAAGLLYAARTGARVANISFATDGVSATLASAVRQVHDAYGMVVVAASGNAGLEGVKFPAYLPQVLAVASSGAPEDPDARSRFSDWGPEVAVAAPGLNIVSTVPQRFCGSHWLCIQGEPYAISSGTSFAAPFVSALAALLISQTPNLPPDAVRQMIMQSAQPLPDGDIAGWDGAGRIRMPEALGIHRYYLGAPAVTAP